MLPESIDRDKISAEFSKGVLTLMLPKTPDARKQQKKAEVKAAWWSERLRPVSPVVAVSASWIACEGSQGPW